MCVASGSNSDVLMYSHGMSSESAVGMLELLPANVVEMLIGRGKAGNCSLRLAQHFEKLRPIGLLDGEHSLLHILGQVAHKVHELLNLSYIIVPRFSGIVKLVVRNNDRRNCFCLGITKANIDLRSGAV